MNEQNTIVINLLGGPGSGKSTIAAGLFYKLKCEGIYDTELVTEVAKDLIWSGAPHILSNQSYVFGEQYLRLWRLLNKVDVVITDSPLLNSIIYDIDNSNELKNHVIEKFNTFNNINYVISRTDYQQGFIENGRVNNHESSIIKDKEMQNVLDESNINYIIVDGKSSEEKVEFIFEDLKRNLKSI